MLVEVEAQPKLKKTRKYCYPILIYIPTAIIGLTRLDLERKIVLILISKQGTETGPKVSHLLSFSRVTSCVH